MNKNIFTQLKSEYAYLTKVERRIADFILKDPQNFINYSMPELSSACNVSQGSINNFSKKFSSGGYSSLKLKVAGFISMYKSTPSSAIDKDMGVKNAMEDKIRQYAESFENTLEINDEATLSEVANKIIKAKKIEVYGFYQSAIVARDICHQLTPLGIPVTFISDHFMCAVSASMLDSDSLVIAVSSSGRTKEVIDCVEIAKKNKVPIVCLTSNKVSPLAKISDNILLAVSSGISSADKPSEIRMSELFVVDALCAYIKCVISDEQRKTDDKLQSIFNSHSVYD